MAMGDKNLAPFTYTGDWDIEEYAPGLFYARFLSSGIFTPTRNMNIDIFLVGGGGNGATYDGGATANRNRGGGGGYTANYYGIKLIANSPTTVTIGASGSLTSFGGTYTAAGGSSGELVVGLPYSMGGKGGSGGGGGGNNNGGGAGGSDGGNGGIGNARAVGVGQGTTTRPFSGDVAPFTSMQFAGGGGGGGAVGGAGGGGNGGASNGGKGADGTPNTGGGGGGGGASSNVLSGPGGAGGSGIVIIRGVLNQPPTDPGPISYGRVKAGDSVILTCGESTDADEDAVSYVWERRVDTGVWTQIAITDTPEATDIVPADGVYYQVRVKAADTKGGESGYATGAAVLIIYNDPPVIIDNIESGELGDLTAGGLRYTFSVSDDADAEVAVEISIDGVSYRQLSVPVDTPQTFELTAGEWTRVLNGSHTLAIKATDSFGESATRTLTFTRNQSRLAVAIKNPRSSEFRPTRMALNLSAAIPAGAVTQILACNNALDASPVWEDVTQPVAMHQAHIFQNGTKAAESWAVNVLVKVDRNGAAGDCYVTGFVVSYDTDSSASVQIAAMSAQTLALTEMVVDQEYRMLLIEMGVM